MKNIIRITNLNSDFKVNKILSLDEYGFIYYLINKGNDLLLESLQQDINMNIDEFKNICKSLDEKGILTLDFQIKQYESVIWDLSFIKQESLMGRNYLDIFKISDAQIHALSQIIDEKELILRLFRMYQADPSIYDINEEIIINNEEDYIKYLRSNSPITILHSNQIKPTIKEINLIFNYVYKEDYPKDVINFLLEYVITTSTYNNLSIEYFVKIISNWQKHNIKSLPKAMEYIKSKKEELSKSTNKYVEPKWEQEEIEMVQQDLEDVKRLLEKK